MKLLKLFLLVLTAAISVSACKIVYDKDKKSVIPPGPEGDVARNDARLASTFDDQLLPLISEKALSVQELNQIIASELDAAGQQHGNRGSGLGAAWNFALNDSGKIVEAKLDTSARKLGVDTDGDGTTDITVQLGPVIRGTALRDFAPFYNFDEFRDQIEFAKLSRAINERIKKSLSVPEGELVGRSLSFKGVIAIKKQSDKFLLTPVSIEFSE
ncbi:MAG: DUF2291 domain-containing protein [Granulosicoccus sp.]|nr:DUF2291 domain-containing protein [Granulosicoccus sp.]